MDVPITLRRWFVAHFVVDFFLGIPLLIAPGLVLHRLGWTTVDGRPYLVRQFRDMKGSIDPSLLKAGQLDDYARVVGVVLARAHAQSIDPRVLHGYADADGEGFDKAFARFAVSYADQTEADHARFRGDLGRLLGR